MSAATMVRRTATVFQALSLVGFIALLCFEQTRLTGPENWLAVLGFFLIPLLVQVIICRFLSHPIIHVSSIIASILIILFLHNDLFTRGYVPVTVFLTLPATVIVLFVGTVVFSIHKAVARSSKTAPEHGSARPMVDDEPRHQSDGPPAV